MTAGGYEEAPVRLFRADRFVTMAGADVAALAVTDGVVLASGPWEQVRGRFPYADVVELAGTVVPGLNDAHIHLAMMSEDLLHLDLSATAVSSNADLLRVLRAEAARTEPGGWVRGSRYDDVKTGRGAVLTRADLDDATGEVPTLVVQVAGHWGIVNSAALAAAGIHEDTAPPPGGDFGRDGAGRHNGVLYEQALFDFAYPAASRDGRTVAPASSEADRLTGLARAVRRWHAAGLTSICDAFVGAADLELFAEARRRGLLTLRTGVLVGAAHYDAVRALGSDFGDEMLRIVGVKTFVDGAIGGRTCLLDEPHCGRSDHGIQSTSTDELRDIVRTVHGDGNRLGVHANGDRAIRLLLDLYDEAATAEPRPGLRHRVEHCSLIDDDIVERLSNVDAIALPFGSYAHYHGGALLDWYGPDRVSRMFPHRTLLDAGVTVAGSSDYPCGPYEPLLALQSCVTRTGFDGTLVGPEQRISVDEALHCYTVGSAVATGEAERKGRLAPGYLADFTVLGSDPRTVDPHTLADVPVRSTWVGGRRVWDETDEVA